jgi:O-antigen/teichoic acid export membrane protein
MYIFAPGITIAKKTHLILYINIVGALLNVVLNYLIIILLIFIMINYLIIIMINLVISLNK